MLWNTRGFAFVIFLYFLCVRSKTSNALADYLWAIKNFFALTLTNSFLKLFLGEILCVSLKNFPWNFSFFSFCLILWNFFKSFFRWHCKVFYAHRKISPFQTKRKNVSSHVTNWAINNEYSYRMQYRQELKQKQIICRTNTEMFTRWKEGKWMGKSGI